MILHLRQIVRCGLDPMAHRPNDRRIIQYLKRNRYAFVTFNADAFRGRIFGIADSLAAMTTLMVLPTGASLLWRWPPRTSTGFRHANERL